MKDVIALALIKRMVANGLLETNDISAICDDLGARDKAVVQAAWIEALCPDYNNSGIVFEVITGGKAQ